MENRNVQIINRKTKEVVRDYKNEGYIVIENPSKNDVPDFLKNFQPDIIAKKDNDNVIIEIKISTLLNKNNFLELEEIASRINAQENWRFELIFTNPKDFEENFEEEFLNERQLNSRIEISKNLVDKDINIAFLSLWTTFENASRKVTESESFKNKTISGIIKKLYSKSIINHIEYNNLDTFVKLRNNISHGYNSTVNELQFNILLELILKIIGKSRFSFIYNWIDNLDLDNYLEVYGLYTATTSEGDFGIIKSTIVDDKIELFASNNETLKINNEDEKNALIEYLSQEFMNGLDAETYYSLNYSLEKDD